MRALPPTLSAEHCQAHDEGIWSTAEALLWRIPDEEEAHRLATLPTRLGGLGLRSAARCVSAAFWVFWADSLQMIRQRTPDVAITVEHSLVNENPKDGCLEELRAAAAELDRQGFSWRPSWVDLREDKRPLHRYRRDRSALVCQIQVDDVDTYEDYLDEIAFNSDARWRIRWRRYSLEIDEKRSRYQETFEIYEFVEYVSTDTMDISIRKSHCKRRIESQYTTSCEQVLPEVYSTGWK